MMMPWTTFLFAAMIGLSNQHPLELDTGDEIITVKEESLALPYLDLPILNEDHFNHLVSLLQEKTFKAPINAKIDEHNRIIPGQTGLMLDRDGLREAMMNYLYKGVSSIDVPILKTYPKVDTEILAHIRTNRIGSYVTYFNKKNEERTNNIILASGQINNTVVFPGETFSFNKTVGKRTKGKGYMKAPVIVKGELSEDIGGGICQVSSTLFNAVDRAGVKIVERYHHSKRVPYVPKGRDATVSWYGPDFAFRNPYHQPILIRSKVIGGQMIVTIFSSDQVEAEKRSVPGVSPAKPSGERP
ncbi:VanW family protein [Rossellomorea marisflavi]|uniref:VanW family protein n=1 Tax=Rossellomorea marisflavi TaxID=189381 RepID=UPI003D80F374